MPDLTLSGPWAKLKFRVSIVKIKVLNTHKTDSMGSNGLLKGSGGGPRGQSSRSCKIWWYFECKITAYICSIFWNVNVRPLLFCSYDFATPPPPGSLALGPDPTGPVVNPACTCHVFWLLDAGVHVVVIFSFNSKQWLIGYGRHRICFILSLCSYYRWLYNWLEDLMICVFHPLAMSFVVNMTVFRTNMSIGWSVVRQWTITRLYKWPSTVC